MLRILLIATALLAASGSALAHNDRTYGRVIAVEPRISVSFGTGYHDGFRVLVESGGSRYWTDMPHHPGRAIVLPPPHRVTYVRHYRDYGYRDYGRGWDDRGRKDQRDNWREDRREHRSDRRDQRRHGRD
ncbi:MAG TPA: hypothetical protein VMV78_11115 [Thiobacillus sp.]|nr:hypothetical protein [Thiobacillus sp.]